MREHFTLPVLEDVLPKLSDATKFSVFDLQQVYLQCELDEESSLLTSCSTAFGKRYCWKRLPFGLSSSSEQFGKRLHENLEGLEGVLNIADDIIVYGSDDNHDDRARKLLERCKERNIKLNKKKCQIGLSEISFQGHLIGASGLKPDPDKVEAIVNMPAPADREGVERLRGTINYLSRFLPKLTTVFSPIAQLTHQGVDWMWGKVQEEAFAEVKRLVAKAPTLSLLRL
jgi:hypothetical protein